eukprot:scaffold803_cov310-Pinguiococcus_pyrenoidosus.AAC.153
MSLSLTLHGGRRHQLLAVLFACGDCPNFAHDVYAGFVESRARHFVLVLVDRVRIGLLGAGAFVSRTGDLFVFARPPGVRPQQPEGLAVRVDEPTPHRALDALDDQIFQDGKILDEGRPPKCRVHLKAQEGLLEKGDEGATPAHPKAHSTADVVQLD